MPTDGIERKGLEGKRMNKADLGKRIRQCRVAKGYTQLLLAKKADIGIMYLGEIERGIKMPSLSCFMKLIQCLDISADYILRDELPTGSSFICDEVSKKLLELTPQQRKTAVDILDAYINNLC